MSLDPRRLLRPLGLAAVALLPLLAGCVIVPDGPDHHGRRFGYADGYRDGYRDDWRHDRGWRGHRGWHRGGGWHHGRDRW